MSEAAPSQAPATPAPGDPQRRLPERCDVLVVGAGPAGSACARTLALAGVDVLLIDQHDFPRDKVCGDGLIPDAHAALKRLGLHEAVMQRARLCTHVRFVATRGAFIDVPGSLAVLPRKTLDELLARAAADAGARLLTPVRFEAPLIEGGGGGAGQDGRVVGARLKVHGEEVDVRARWVVLATGAVPRALIAAGLCERQTPSGVALRGYVHHPGLAEGTAAGPGRIDSLHLVWHPRLRGGYGWIFPAPGGLFNIGAGLTGSHRRAAGGKGKMADINLRHFFDAFCDLYAPARELMAGGTLQGKLEGAPLRCSLVGSRWTRDGLLAAGEAIGSTYAFSGEGIGKAMETGLLAAEALLAAARDDDAAVRARYEAGLRAIKPKFDLYETASHVNHRPWLTDLVVWRANKSERIRRRMAGVLEETQNPGRLLSWRGITKLMFE